jgi:hypothetical protein
MKREIKRGILICGATTAATWVAFLALAFVT